MPPRSSQRPQRRRHKARRRMLRNRSPPLLDLPVEVMVLVFEHLPTLKALSSAAEACRAMHNVFSTHSGLLIRRILSKACDSVWASSKPYEDICHITADLEFAVHRHFFPRSNVEDAFVVAWRLFTATRLEEILYPIARELAWTYYLDGRLQDAVEFLKAIQYHEGPYFLPPCRITSPARLPVARLLHYFLDNANDVVQREVVARDITHLADLKNHYTTFIWITNLTAEQSRNCAFTMFFPPQPPFSLHSEPFMNTQLESMLG